VNFDLDEAQQATRDAIRDLAQREFAPRAAEYDRSHEFPAENMSLLAQYGYLGMTLPEEYGGAGFDWISYAICVEEVSRACAATGVIFEVHNSLHADAVYSFGNEEQRNRWLPDLCRGKRLGAFCLTEPGAGSDAGSLRLGAVLEGDHYVLNGTKTFITNAGIADNYLVMARTDKEAGNRGITAFIVEKETEGLSFGEPEDKLGILGSPTADVIFEDARVPVENRLGEEGQGFKVALATLDGGRIGIAAQAVGISQAALDLALAYSKEREQFGRPICRFQATQWKLADMATELDAARLLLYRAAFLRGKGVRASKEIAMAKLFASEMSARTTQKALQIHGGYGYVRDYTVERLMRDAKITELYEGTSEVMRIVISSALLNE